MFYCFHVCTDSHARKPENRRWMRFYSQTLLDRGHPFADVQFNLGHRLTKHLRRKGHTVIRI